VRRREKRKEKTKQGTGRREQGKGKRGVGQGAAGFSLRD
jgi:hypothetical protein